MRFIHAVREFNHEHGECLQTIALFTEPDRNAMFVREADDAVFLGPALVTDPNSHQTRSSYVDYERLRWALTAARADAVWAGWGFVAEDADFADLCRNMGIKFIGPDGDAMRRVADKISSKRLAEQLHIPVARWSGGPVETLPDALRQGERLGYPLLVKATAGGGGRGIRRVLSADQLPQAFTSARSEAHKAFGDPTVFMEELVPVARHIEVQIIADQYGTTWPVGVRDCTIQRRHQKILEEAPSPELSPEQDDALRKAAVRLSQAAGYQNAGTVEFLYEPESRRLLFMEMNTRLQVEHPVTECTTGLDLVKLQIHIARGGRLLGEPPQTTGHAIEVRLNAEDPDNDFAPAPGVLERFRILTGPGVRVDTGVGEGDSIPPEFDSMIAKIIAHGQNRKEALSRLQRALRKSVVVIRGGASNKAFLLELLNRPEVESGQVDVGWIERVMASGHSPRQYADVALVQAAIEACNAQLTVEQALFYASAARGRPQVRSEAGVTVALRFRGNPYSLTVFRLGPHHYRVEMDGCSMDAHVRRLGQFEYWLTCFGRRFSVVSIMQGMSYRIEVEGVAHRIDRDDGGLVYATLPSVVVSVPIKPGDLVSLGDPLVVLEAMKMETQVVAPFSGRVRQVMAMPNVQVDAGSPLVQLDAMGGDDQEMAAQRIGFGAPLATQNACEDGHAQCLEKLEEIRQLMLGFDVEPAQTARLLKEWKGYCEGPAESAEFRKLEEEILQIFVDISSLFHRAPEMNSLPEGEAPSSEVYLFSYLRALETRGEGLSPAFGDALHRALAHYGVCTLDPSPELEESLLWIYKSHQRAEHQIASVQCVLERRLEHIEALAPYAGDSFRTLLDRMIALTSGHYPAISDLAWEVRYRYFDQPVFERARSQVYAEVENHLSHLAAHPQAEDRDERIRAMVECPQPLVPVFSGRFATPDSALCELMLEVLTRRYYRVQTLHNVHSVELPGQRCVFSEYQADGKKIHLLSTHAEFSRLLDAARAIFPLLQAVPGDCQVVIDFYLWQQDLLSDPETAEQKIRLVLNQVGFPHGIERIVVALAGPGHSPEMSGMHHFTYRPGVNGFEEEKLYRGLHPMMGQRLDLWRFSNFKLERLPSVEDVYLFHAVSRENPKDQRLFAVAEVRDLTPVCDPAGRIVQLPHLERMFSEALAGIRLYQSHRSSHERLYWNRILLNVWPPLRVKPDEFHDIVHRLVPATEGLGLEQVVLRARIPHPDSKPEELRDMVVRISSLAGAGFQVSFRPAVRMLPLKPLAEYDQKVVRMRQRGLIYPYEIVKMLTPALEDTGDEFPPGDFVEHDFNAEGHLVPVDRPYGQNKANIIVGVIRNFTVRYPEGMTRVLLMGDPSKELGSIAEPECRRVLAALDLAEQRRLPVEWFPISAGARISMESGVENMDWIGRVLRRLIEFTQAGGEVNLIVNGINVGAQPYWNAEATMLMHTRGILVMTPQAAMVLTGKRALEYSGSVSAEDNQGIGGYDRIMGVNGQAQYWARDINDACHILFHHYEHTYVAPGERFPRCARTTDPVDRDVRLYPHSRTRGDSFAYVGEIFSDRTNPGRKKSFDIRTVMMAVVDQDHPPLERWPGMRAAETVVVWDAHLGGYPVCLIGIESRPVPRLGFAPADGPDQWTAGTLFPTSSKKVARAINAASNNRPVVVLANLSGFDGSPESMRKLQLEYGAEIGRAVVNFKGPMIFCVISRYHGGAYVVFSHTLNENLKVVALEGTYASVIGGAPAAAVVFAGEVEARTRKDERLQSLSQTITRAEGVEKHRLRANWDELFKAIYSEKLGEVAREFDHIHSVHRALAVGALDEIILPEKLRPYLIHALEEGVGKQQDSLISETEKPLAPAATEAA